jgi:DeoR/GlpR family transcriptional regulator of sugar metabolism
MNSSKKERLCKLLQEVVHSNNRATSFDLAEKFGLSRNRVVADLHEAKKRGWVTYRHGGDPRYIFCIHLRGGVSSGC